MDFTKSFKGKNACFVQREGVSALQFVQIPDGRFALILDDLPVEISMRLPRPEGEEGFWLCDMTIAYGEVIKVETLNPPESEVSGVHEKPKAEEPKLELHWMTVEMFEAMRETRRENRARYAKVG